MNVATIMRMALALNSQIAFRVFNLYHWLATEGVIGVVRSVFCLLFFLHRTNSLSSCFVTASHRQFPWDDCWPYRLGPNSEVGLLGWAGLYKT